ncbi:MAG: YncE family protein [Solirubrobacteraceae bacterium]
MKTIKLLHILFFGLLIFQSCTKDEEIVSLASYENGFFIPNEGNFGRDEGEVTFISNDLQTVKQDVFKSENNGAVLGNVLQSIAIYQDKAYLVVNSSNKIEVVDRKTFKKIATINSQLNNPRYIAFANGKGYVTNWGAGSNPNDDYVAVLNLSTNTVDSTIPVVEGPEKIESYNNNLYVAHQGGLNFNDKISVINSSNNSVSTIGVGDVPKDMAVYNNQLFVLCSGKESYHSGGKTDGNLNVINLLNNSVSTLKPFTDSKPSQMALSGNELFYTQGKKVFKANLSSTTFSTQEIISSALAIPYGFNVDANRIYFLDAVDYAGSFGKVYIYTKQGSLVTTKDAGLYPNGISFN